MENEKEKKKGNIAVIIICLIAFGTFIYCFCDIVKSFNAHEGLFDRTAKTGSFVKGEATYSTSEIYGIKHTINYIPTGTEYFYVVVDSTLEDYVVVKAPKNWKYSGFGDGIKTFSISGKVRKFDHRNVAGINESVDRLSLDNDRYIDYFIDITAQRNAIMTDICIIVITLLIVLLVQIIRNVFDWEEKKKNSVIKVIVILLLIALIALIHYTDMIL